MTRFGLAGIGDEAGPLLDDQLDALAELGWRAIELRTIGGKSVADLSDRGFDAVLGTLVERGITTVCVDSRIGDWATTITGDFGIDLDELDVLASRCRALGTRYVRVMSYPNDGLPEPEWERRVLRRMRELAHHAEQADLVLLHENCAGWAGSSAKRMLRMLETVASPALKLLFDTGNGMAYGYSGPDLLREVIEHVEHVHIKDAVAGDPDPVYTVPGAGDAGVADCLRMLAEHGYSGVLSIEPHLSLRPHEGSDGAGTVEGFIAAGRALAALLDERGR